VSASSKAGWQVLLDKGLVDDSMPPEPAMESPWYVRLMLGIAGWIAALFLLGFIAAGLAWIIRSELASVLTGMLMVCIAWLMLRKLGEQEFAVQFALALSFAGQVLFAVGIFGWLGLEQEATAAWLVMSLFQALLAAVMPNSIHRFWSAIAMTVAFYMLLYSLNLAFVSPAIILGVAAWAWLNEFSWPALGEILRPVAYGLLLGLMAMDSATGAFQPLIGMGVGLATQGPVPSWLGAMLSGAVMVSVVWILLRRWRVSMPGKTAVLALSSAVILVLFSLKVPGIATGCCIILLGYAHGNRVLTGLGIAALLLYLSTYYYSLDATLLVKSQALAVSGAVLLTLRWLLLRLLPPEENQSDE
jgi:uncharacterized membrane protein